MAQMRVRPSESPRWTLGRVAGQLHVDCPAPADIAVCGLSLNTSDVVPGDLYAALPGSRAHGAVYVPQALAAGAVAVLTDAEGRDLIDADVPIVVVDRPRRELAALAVELYGRPTTGFTTLGVTGTQGKTTTTHLAESAVGAQRSAVVGTVGTRIRGVEAASKLTTPEAPALQALFAVMREEQIELCAMEVSSHALVQGRVDGFAFDVGVFLNLGRDHLDFHRDLEDYFAAKALLFTSEHARRAVVNVDDERGRQLVGLTELPVTTFSTDGSAADWRGVNIRPHRLGTDATILGPDGSATELSVPLPGAFNMSNALAVVAALTALGYDPTELAAGIASSPGVPGRMQRVELGQDFTVVVDYAHKPDAVSAVLAALRPTTPGRLIIVVGAGGDRDRGKRPLMGGIASRLADVVVVTDDNPRHEDPAAIRAEILDGVDGDAEIVEIGDRRQAIEHALALAQAGDTVVVAGKGHERGQQIGDTITPFDDVDTVAGLLRGGR